IVCRRLCICKGGFHLVVVRTDENARPLVARIGVGIAGEILDHELYRSHQRYMGCRGRYYAAAPDGGACTLRGHSLADDKISQKLGGALGRDWLLLLSRPLKVQCATEQIKRWEIFGGR